MLSKILAGNILIGSKTRQANFQYTFEIKADGKIYYKENTPQSELKPLYVRGFLKSQDKQFIALYAAINTLFAVDKNGEIWRVENIHQKPETFFWLRAFGWPFSKGPGINIDLNSVTAFTPSSASKSTVGYYVDPSGDKVERFITHLYTTLKNDGFIHHTDPWTPADWLYRFPMPIENGSLLLPSLKGISGYAVGLSASASVVGLINAQGVYTINYDFDINGANPLVIYKPFDTEHHRRISKLFFNKYEPIALPAPGWNKQPEIPGLHTANILMDVLYNADGSVVQGGERILSVIGLEGEIPGRWVKKLTDANWEFYPDPSLSVAQIKANGINDEVVDTRPVPVDTYVDEIDQLGQVELKNFGAYVNLFKGNEAKLDFTISRKKFELDLYTHIQMRTQANVDSGCFGGYVRIPPSLLADTSKEAVQLRKYLGCDNSGFMWLFIEVKDTGLLIRRGLPCSRKIDLLNPANILLGEKLFYFTKS